MAVTPAPAKPSRTEDRADNEQQSSRRRNRDGGRARKHRGAGSDTRSKAEWITLGISVLIVLSVVALTTYLYVTRTVSPAAMEVETHLNEVYRAGSRFYLPLTISNTGGTTGEDVRVRVAVTDPAGQQESAEVLIPFLAGGGSSRAVAAFASDPRYGQISAAVVSYLEP